MLKTKEITVGVLTQYGSAATTNIKRGQTTQSTNEIKATLPLVQYQSIQE